MITSEFKSILIKCNVSSVRKKALNKICVEYHCLVYEVKILTLILKNHIN